jgi:hypothetical protein
MFNINKIKEIKLILSNLSMKKHIYGEDIQEEDGWDKLALIPSI